MDPAVVQPKWSSGGPGPKAIKSMSWATNYSPPGLSPAAAILLQRNREATLHCRFPVSASKREGT